MIKVLVVETTLYGHDGITTVVKNYYKYQNHDQIHMDLVTINPVDEGFKCELEKYGNTNYILPHRNKKPLKYLFDLIKIIKGECYQIIHVHGCSSTMAVEMLAAKIAGVKARIAHSHNTKCDHAKIDKILRPLFSKWCNVGFACGKEAGEWLFPDRQFYVISNGIDLEKYEYNSSVREQMRSKYDLNERFVIGHVGRFSEQKNHEKLIDIFAEIAKVRSDAKLVLIGDGELKAHIEEKVNKLQLDVLFVGLSNEVEKWLQAMDAMVFPSLFEGLPLGMVEAQAAGLPCVLSDTISPDTEIIDLVRFVRLSDSAAQWSKTVIDMSGKFDRRSRDDFVQKQIKEAGFDIIENCKQLNKIYESILEDTK